MRKLVLVGIIFFSCLFFVIDAFAQPTGGGPGGDPDAPVPIGGVEILILSGIAFGIKKLYNKKEN